jgi:hypothetical protein
VPFVILAPGGQSGIFWIHSHISFRNKWPLLGLHLHVNLKLPVLDSFTKPFCFCVHSAHIFAVSVWYLSLVFLLQPLNTPYSNPTWFISEGVEPIKPTFLLCRSHFYKILCRYCYTCALTEYHDVKTYGVTGGIAPLILDLGIRWRWVLSFTPRPLYPPGNEPLVPIR